MPEPSAVPTLLEAIPTVLDLAADPITHGFDDMLALPGLTNFIGTVRIEQDLTAVSALTVPPLGQGHTVTGQLFVDGVLFRALGAQVSTRWRPDRVVRSATLDGLELEATTIMVPGEAAVLTRLRAVNTGPRPRPCRLALGLGSRVSNPGRPWLAAEPPGEDNLARVDERGLVAHSPDGSAWSVQRVLGAELVALGVRAADAVHPVGIGGNPCAALAEASSELAPGESLSVAHLQTIGTRGSATVAAADRIAADVDGILQRQEPWWNERLRAVFTPGNEDYSGHLPQLHTSSPELRRLYWWGALGTMWFRRDNPASAVGRSYDTLMPNYWASTTFIWDYSLSGLTHALLDPDVLVANLSRWIDTDIHTHFGTEYLTGGPVGAWYSVNDYAMTRLVDDCVRFATGAELLAREVAGRPVAAHLREWATAWRALADDSGLADYGEIDNLLECVGSYVHQVASLNAANVWCLRAAAKLTAGRAGLGGADATQLRAAADELAARVLGLYRSGEGFFDARQPGGARVPVRHCYDFSTVGTTMAADLPPRVRRELVDFFVRELQSDTWMRALSRRDVDAGFSVRPDHQWNGAYPAWPADALRALCALGAEDEALAWIPGLTRSMNQGPPGQAHFTSDARPPVNGGAAKAPPQLPYIIDWACSSAGAWCAVVIESLFGLRAGIDGGLSAGGPIARLDPHALLTGVRVQGRLADVDATGRVVWR